MIGQAIASGRVWHQRNVPFTHRFAYPLWLVWCDLDEIPALLDRSPWWGRAWRPVVFRARDFVDSTDTALSDKVRGRASDSGLDWQQGRVCMLGQWRTFGTLFNPLVLYLHFPEGSDQPDSMLAEVQNTPWKEKHFYALPLAANEAGTLEVDHDKSFHVSPFLPMALRYHWRLHVAFPDLRLVLEDKSDNEVVFAAGLNLTLLHPERAVMRNVIVRMGARGFVTLKGIYWQAFKLWRKGARFYRHPQRQHSEQNKSERRG
ncbi:DUF1365 domain-containing protein [Alcanivorax sp. DP30]|uniref:DUF1365 domain-containing protein n=1 Tax=Alcanivorax sp. DP30 TaxID=2606217 RepID=UPI001370323B|nr:DUF1365 domain-containing protein [Alcanivorax sp. DP30]MZR62254.1 DUF1365 family protein [Alcanivorax sp. DP30]